ncbi:MAG: hypothetical protein H0W88_03630 [Parachlamydiaceae bacterium]|nr:hypothetical protein [Parachlamydiaceae bacterium]
MNATPLEDNTKSTFIAAEEHKKSETPAKKAATTIESIAPRLIFLSGTSTSGKSTIMRSYAQSSSNRKELGTDDFEETRCASLIQKHCPEEYAILSQAIENKDLYRFLFTPPDFIKSNPNLFFKAGSTDSQKAEVFSLNDSKEFFPKITSMLKKNKPTQDKEHFETILNDSRKGISVIFDTPNAAGFFEHFKEASHDIRVERFLVYVPLSDLVKRLPGRNAEAIKTGNFPNQRPYIDLLNQFKNMYRKAEPDEDAIDTLTREEVRKIFADNKKDIEDENKNVIENGRSFYTIEEEEYLKHFGLTEPGSRVKITSVTDYRSFNRIFRTATETPDLSLTQVSSHSWKEL